MFYLSKGGVTHRELRGALLPQLLLSRVGLVNCHTHTAGALQILIDSHSRMIDHVVIIISYNGVVNLRLLITSFASRYIGLQFAINLGVCLRWD